MIKATELRIGNWLMTDKEEQVVDVLCDSLSTNDYQCITYDMVVGIPITEEWLLNLGLTKEQDHIFVFPNTSYRLWGFGWELQMFLIGGDWVDVNIKRIKYIHNVQNVYFELTGKELKKII